MNRKQKTSAVWSAMLAALLSCSAASAATINEPFSSPLGGLPSGFTLAANGDTSTSKIVTVGGNNYLQLGVTDSSTQNAALYYTAGDTAATANNQFGDFSGSVILQVDNTATVSAAYSVVLRAQSPAFNTSSAYYIAFVPKTTGSHLRIYKGSGVLASSTTYFASNLSNHADYQLTFSAHGGTLAANLYALSSPNTVLDTVSTTAAADYSSGYFGLLANTTASPRYVLLPRSGRFRPRTGGIVADSSGRGVGADSAAREIATSFERACS
jgi:hypothetical protein